MSDPVGNPEDGVSHIMAPVINNAYQSWPVPLSAHRAIIDTITLVDYALFVEKLRPWAFRPEKMQSMSCIIVLGGTHDQSSFNKDLVKKIFRQSFFCLSRSNFWKKCALNSGKLPLVGLPKNSVARIIDCPDI